MKKLSILFLLMLFTLGVSAQVKSLDELSPEKTYTIRNPHHNAYAIYERSKSAFAYRHCLSTTLTQLLPPTSDIKR